MDSEGWIYIFMHIYIYAVIIEEKRPWIWKGIRGDMIPLEEYIGEGMNREKEFVLPLSHFWNSHLPNPCPVLSKVSSPCLITPNVLNFFSECLFTLHHNVIVPWEPSPVTTTSGQSHPLTSFRTRSQALNLLASNSQTTIRLSRFPRPGISFWWHGYHPWLNCLPSL